ncbi:MAG: hypothetical protein PF450_16250, partial [Bacteroidales bacterium]|nr:hypothetical protein [Bacteroidales bacterium]
MMNAFFLNSLALLSACLMVGCNTVSTMTLKSAEFGGEEHKVNSAHLVKFETGYWTLASEGVAWNGRSYVSVLLINNSDSAVWVSPDSIRGKFVEGGYADSVSIYTVDRSLDHHSREVLVCTVDHSLGHEQRLQKFSVLSGGAIRYHFSTYGWLHPSPEKQKMRQFEFVHQVSLGDHKSPEKQCIRLNFLVWRGFINNLKYRQESK